MERLGQVQPVIGKCHVCQTIQATIRYKKCCKHWIGDCCRRDVVGRVASALFSDKSVGCCGPDFGLGH